MLNRELLLASGGNPLQMGVGPVYDYHGFKLQRHSSQEATIISYKAADGTMQRIAVKDAKFRNVLQFGLQDRDMSGCGITDGRKITKPNFIASSTFIPCNKPMPDEVTNATLFDNCSQWLAGDKSAKANCDIWMTYNGQTDEKGIKGVPAVAWCRAQTLAGKPCDLGNEYENCVIFICGDKLDEMDPTYGAYPTFGLGYTSAWYKSSSGYNGRTMISADKSHLGTERWASSPISTSSTDTIAYNGRRNCLGRANWCGVVPILELEP